MKKSNLFFIEFLIIMLSTIMLNAGYIGFKIIDVNDNSIADWTNNTTLHFLSSSNIAYVTDNQYIWQDVANDDRGDGDYIYPTNSSTFGANSADIDQFRVCWDTTNLYIFLRANNATADWWASAFIIGIDIGTPDTGSEVLIQGDKVDPETGPCAELRSTKIKCDYTIFASSTYKCRMWNAAGIKIGDDVDTLDDGNLNNIDFQSPSWNEWEIKIPLSLIGSNPSDSTWHYIVGLGHEENNYFREIQPDNSGNPMEWYGINGDNSWWSTNGVDPDVYDLIGADQVKQESDLNSYNINGTPGETNDFVDIQYSYVTVADYNRFFIQPQSISVQEREVVPLTILGCNSTSTGEFLNKQYTIKVYNDVGTVIDNKFYAADLSYTDLIQGYITFSMQGVSSYTLYVTVSASASDINVRLSKNFLQPGDEYLTFNFDIGKEEKVEVFIYSLAGELLKKIEKVLTPIENNLKWYKDTDDNNKVGSGLYLIKVKIGNKVFIKKILLVN